MDDGMVEWCRWSCVARTAAMLASLMCVCVTRMQVCNHPFLFEEYDLGNEYLIRSCGKLALLDRVLPKLQVSLSFK